MSVVQAQRDPLLVWIAIQEAAQEHRDAELAEIAISLFGQLGEAKAEVSRLRASLRSSLTALSASAARLGYGGRRPGITAASPCRRQS
jgi:hypothetical protein